jgi:polysaccharide export outer membrane protein
MKHTMISTSLAATVALATFGAIAVSAQGPRTITPGAPRMTAARPPAAVPAADTKPPEPAVVADEYRLGPGDKLRIEVYKDTQLSQSVQIRPDGKITLPLVDDIDASGRTPVELRDELTRELKEYVHNPVVTVVVVEATAATAYIIGAVNHPGSIPVLGDLTVLQALALAGGLNDWADSKHIRILRKSGAGVQTIPFNYRDAIKGAGPLVYLRAGDTVIVPE